MSATAARRARLLRLRTIEHRIAAVQLAAADAAHDTVAGVSGRVAALRDGIRMPSAICHGHDLHGMSELSDRLDRAQAGLQPSLAESWAIRTSRQDERIAAHIAEERTGRVHDTASRREAAERDLRIATSRPPRVRKVEERS
jgi:hypothetical protein